MARRLRLRALLRRWAVDGVDVVQLREKWMKAGELFALATDAMDTLRAATPDGGRRPRLLLNGRADIALAAGADGVHLSAREGEFSSAQVRQLFRELSGEACLISNSCHTQAEVAAAHEGGVDFILFGPVFGKWDGATQVVGGLGLQALREACLAAASTPVLALGGITAGNTASCLDSGAAGVAAIRLFAQSL